MSFGKGVYFSFMVCLVLAVGAVAGGGLAHARCYPVAECRGSNHLCVSAIAEYQAFELVVYHHIERQLYGAVAESQLYLLRFVEWL